MPIPKALASYFHFVTNFHFATFTFMKHESREWVKGKESKRLRVKKTKRRKILFLKHECS